MSWFTAHALIQALRSRRGVTAAEYAVMSVALVSLCAVCGLMVGQWFGPTLNAVTQVISGG